MILAHVCIPVHHKAQMMMNMILEFVIWVCTRYCPQLNIGQWSGLFVSSWLCWSYWEDWFRRLFQNWLPVASPMKGSSGLKSFSHTQCDSELIQNLSPGAVSVNTNVYIFTYFCGHYPASSLVHCPGQLYELIGRQLSGEKHSQWAHQGCLLSVTHP